MDLNSPQRYDEAFTELLQAAVQERYPLNNGEKVVFYRVLQESYNPLGIYFTIAGAAIGYSLLGATTPRRGFVTTACALYAWEFSWWLVDANPTRRFFRDIVSVQGHVREEALLSYKTLCSPKIELSSPLWTALSFLTLSRSLQRRSSKRTSWRRTVPAAWYPTMTMDPLTALYWGAA